MQNLSCVTTVILAGGLGTRLRSVVPGRPKVLANILGRPFLTFLLDQLVLADVRDVVLCTGYMADEIDKQLGNTYKSLRLVYSRENVHLDTGGALRLALPHLNSDAVLIMNGDSFVDIDLTVYLDWFFKKKCQAALLLTNVTDTGRYGKVVVAEDGLLLAFEEKGFNIGPGWINAGVYIMKKSLIATIPAGTPFSLEREFFPKLVDKGLYGFCFKGEFIDIGTPETFALAEEFFLSI
jgi:D-glycero-alpha-D-manno-heptose 1-phosphate guanylyltransferase